MTCATCAASRAGGRQAGSQAMPTSYAQHPSCRKQTWPEIDADVTPKCWSRREKTVERRATYKQVIMSAGMPPPQQWRVRN